MIQVRINLRQLEKIVGDNHFAENKAIERLWLRREVEVFH